MTPFAEALEYVNPGTYNDWKAKGYAVATTTSFTRGINWRNSFVIIDEAQNFELDELQTVYTRCTDDCKVVTLGSLRQNDNGKIRKYAGYTPFEVFMEHYATQNVTFNKLETNYRGWFSEWADEVGKTLKKLEGGEG